MKTFEKKSKMTTPPVRCSRTPVLPSFNPAAQIQRAQIRQVLRSPQLQAKLAIGQPYDKYEQEADRVAEEVMRMPEQGLQRQVEPEEEEEETLQTKPIGDQITPLVQRQVEPEEEEEPIQAQFFSDESSIVQRQEDKEEELVQPKAGHNRMPAVTPNLESRIQSLRRGGHPLPKETRDFFEPRFGRDFGGVRIHTDSNANQLARSINARAFTRGSDIVCGRGEYRPESFRGRRLLGHELTHVVQQHSKSYLLHRKFREGIARRPSKQPAYWCKPYSSRKEARSEWIHTFLHVVGLMKILFGDEVAMLWANYLKRKPGESLNSCIYSKPYSRIVKGFAESDTTKGHLKWLVGLLKIKLPALCKTEPKLFQPNKWNLISVNKLYNQQILLFDQGYSRK